MSVADLRTEKSKKFRKKYIENWKSTSINELKKVLLTDLRFLSKKLENFLHFDSVSQSKGLEIIKKKHHWSPEDDC